MNTYNKRDIMNWDEAEYNYFMSLDDMTKAYYMHDYLYGELDEEYEGDELEGETSLYNEPDDKPTTKINVILDVDSLWITCDNPKLIKDTIMMFVMDGLLLEHQETFGNTKRYRVIKHGSPISVN
tara:strand:+ start:732 stop:1106 length:375 start_codon:yes stop_codon:yes gene_type:complete